MKGSANDHGQCLTDEVLTDYLEGGLDPAVKAASEVHLIACDNCRLKLGFFMRLLNDEVTAEEAVALKSIQEEWVRAQNDRRVPGKRLGNRGRWKIASGSVAAAMLLALGARVAVERLSEPRSAEEVIHLLLAENRPFEARISGQPHRPFASTRAPSDAGVSYPLLAGQMARLSATGYEMGQFYLLQRDFGRAINYLEMAEQEPGARDRIHNDLGVAYMEAGGVTNLQKAMTEFRHAILANGKFTPAVFNLAVLYDRMGREDQAEAQWKEYLKLEADPKWQDEGRSKLEGITH